MPKSLIPLAIVLVFVARAAESGEPRAERSKDDPKGAVEFLKAFEITEKWIKGELKRRIDVVDQAKLELRKSMIADDIAGIETAKGKIAKSQSKLRDLVDFKFPALDFERLEKGQIGTRPHGKPDLPGTRRPPDFRGQDLVYFFHRKGTTNDIVVYVVGMEGEWKKVGGSELWFDDDTMLFVAVGEIDVGYYEGDKKIGHVKAFEIRACKLDGIFSKDELNAVEAATNTDFTVTLTDSEKESQKKAIEQHSAEKAKADADKVKAAQDAKAKRAQAFVDMGKSLLKSNNKTGARKQFEKAASESPDSDAGKEAKKLLE